MSKLITYAEAKASPGVYRLVSRGAHSGDYVITSDTGVIYVNAFGTPPYSNVIEGSGAPENEAINHYRNEVRYIRYILHRNEEHRSPHQ